MFLQCLVGLHYEGSNSRRYESLSADAVRIEITFVFTLILGPRFKKKISLQLEVVAMEHPIPWLIQPLFCNGKSAVFRFFSE